MLGLPILIAQFINDALVRNSSDFLYRIAPKHQPTSLALPTLPSFVSFLARNLFFARKKQNEREGIAHHSERIISLLEGGAVAGRLGVALQDAVPEADPAIRSHDSEVEFLCLEAARASIEEDAFDTEREKNQPFSSSFSFFILRREARLSTPQERDDGGGGYRCN